jgi:DNA mismatch repair protein MutH
MTLPYDRASKWSIREYSKRLLNKTLEEAITPNQIEEGFRGKGRLGQLVEKYFFGYDINSNQEADFSEAGLELKCTPLKELTTKVLAIKERLVLTMIDFSEDHKKSFEESHVYMKCMFMLILFYLHESGVPVQQLKFIYSVLWQIPEKDLLIMKQDYETIIRKIKDGKAHELSEGDTTYLGACRKGQKGDADVTYTLPNGEKAAVPAPKRAFSLKTQYMRTILEFAQKTGGQGTYNTSAIVGGYGPQLITEQELMTKSFEDILRDRFKPYYGLTYNELVKALGCEGSKAKSKYFLVANEILTEKGSRGVDVTKSEEFKKSGIIIKTIRLKKNGRSAEAMSFENINYFDIMNEDDWYESRLYDILTGRFLFVVFQENEHEETVLKKAFFWTMPVQDLEIAEGYWENISDNVKNNHIGPEYFYKASDHKKFHVRPKAQKATDVTINPHGGTAKKFCYWFNKEYIKEIVDHNIG